MKKSILVAITAIGFTTAANAQFSINPEAGINLANVSASTATNSKMNMGFKVGAMANYTIYRGFYIEPGVMYSVKGYKQEASLLGITSTAKTSLNYLEVPINLGYQFDMGDAGGVFVSAGPYLGFGLSGKVKGSVAGISGDADIKFGSKADELKKLDVGLNFSAGYVSPIGIYVRAQYGLGLTNLSNVNGMSYKNGPVLGFSLGYVFQLNEK